MGGGAKKVLKRVVDPGGLIFKEEPKSAADAGYSAERQKEERAIEEKKAEERKKSSFNKGRSGTLMGGSVGSSDSLKTAQLTGSAETKKKNKFGE
ncbi:hypothetical protein [Halodesulfovibrio spirochaetisodalis]|uniref:Uncharacterized protein n=1 Tax=Halodesulfovibrio spirochaetisodalis TaxID=1560234 RepID=A0A1B7XA51_9BACT|nr:hypothetical protein [Halodesulfovibrio spirochaetisodalis]OBQ46217.1 hypothetical protein SP90_13535 [Halodesulfovibrio spirochaetisodalis]